MVDGDKLLVVSDMAIIDVAKRNIERFDIVPLYYNMRKAEATQLNNESIYNGLNAAFTGGNIGIYSNNISKIWNSEVFLGGNIDEKNNAIDIIKLLTCENNFVIDMAKTLYKPTRPKDVDSKIGEFTNVPLPHFFKYAKDKSAAQVSDLNNSFVNKLDAIIPNPRMNFKSLGLGKIDHRLLMSNPYIEFDVSFTDAGKLIKEKTNDVIVKYCEFDKKYYMALDSMICSNVGNKSDSYMRAKMKYQRITNEIKSSLSQFGYSDVEITDILVKYLYGIKKSKNKTALWLCYGDIVLGNLESNIGHKTKIIQCVDCGEWFDVGIKDSRTCRCGECMVEHKRELARLRKKKQRGTQMSREQNIL